MHYNITPSNAAAMARRSHEVRNLKKAACSIIANSDKPLQEHADLYPVIQLVRVRKHLDTLNEVLEKLLSAQEHDTAEIDKCAHALATLYDLERVLSGRPLPGTNKPGSVKARPQSSVIAPTLGIAPIQPASPSPVAPDQAIDPAI